MARRLGHLPKFTDWAEARKNDASLLTEWQVYRMFDARRGAWSTFQYLVRERLRRRASTVERTGRERLRAAASAASRCEAERALVAGRARRAGDRARRSDRA